MTSGDDFRTIMKSSLFELTKEKGAEFSSFGEWEIPAHYGDLGAECEAAHSSVVLRDASHWRRIRISGADHLDFLHRMTTNNFNNFLPGAGFEAVFIESRARILDVGTFYRSKDSTLAVLSPQAREKIPAWLERYIFAEKISFFDITTTTAMIELMGPRAASICAVLEEDLNAAPDHLLNDPTQKELWLARLDFCGHRGLRIAGSPEKIRFVWEELQAGGALPMGEECWEILRTEAGLPLFDRELTEEYNPWEANLEHAIHPDKGCYIGQEVIARLQTYDKVKQRLMGLNLAPGPLPPPRTPLRVERRDIGKITSAVHSPYLEQNIALAYLRRAYCDPGTEVEYEIEGTVHKAEVSTLPFAPSA